MIIIVRNSIVLLFFALIGLTVTAQNPFLPPYAFIPDGEPHVFKVGDEERLFIYGSRDERVTAYCGEGHDVWSAPVNDLTKWTCHGEIFNIKQVQALGYGKVKDQHFGAPDCVYNPVTKKYYLYTFLGATYKLDGIQGPKKDSVKFSETFGAFGPKCVMAQSDSPYGPFTNPVMCDWEVVNAAGTFDPSVVVVTQPDGSVRVWAYWGMKLGDRWAELNPTDMHTVINSFTRKPDRKSTYKTLNNPALNNNATLYEASSIKQVAKDKFVFIFSPNGKISALTYCYSNSPEGPWTYGGVIINNNKNYRGANNHGSIVKVKDQWYMVYHRQAPNSYNRQAMIEPIDLRIEGDKVVIPEVEMTSQGIFKEGLPYQKRYYAGIVCHIEGKAYVDGIRRVKDGYNPVVVDTTGAVLGYKYFNFGTEKLKNLSLVLNAQATNKFNLKIEVMPKGGSKRIMIGEQEFIPSGKGKSQFVDYKMASIKPDKNLELQQMGGITGSMAVFLTVKPAGSKVEMKELELK
ncbi:MAG: family 43 glycosylhydrolase [Bacteroidota bacterium]|nr:family 43 glycosylhydrolase [Bacteroidota bacterium]